MHGKLNKITDVKGVRVGHKTISDGSIQTGVTVLVPSHENIFQNKLVAACHVINGFGKTSGLIQIEELGTLESILGLTNTFSVGTLQQALVKHAIKENPEIGRTTGTVNVVVGECNDGYLNDIQACVVSEKDVEEAIQNACEDFALGSVGAGTGMSCFELKGGIGSSSRILELDGNTFTLGVLVLTNFGLRKDFKILQSNKTQGDDIENGSIILVIATDLPLSSRQLKRVCKRTPAALARLGSYLGNGSGDIAIAFSTANQVPHESERAILSATYLHESFMDRVFRCTIETCEEAIMSSLHASKTVVGRDGHMRHCFDDEMKNS